MYKLSVSPQAKNFFKNLTKPLYKKAIDQAFQDIKQDPYIGKELTRELVGFRMYRISIYRVIYKIFEKDKKVRIMLADHRSKIYQ